MSIIPGNNITLTASQIVGSTASLIIRTPTANSSDNLDTATNIILAWLGANNSMYNGNSFFITIYNDSNFTITLNPGTGITMYPTSTDVILPQVSRKYIINQFAVSTLNVYMTATSSAYNMSGLVLPNSEIFVGNSSNIATAVSMSGDATLSDTGNLTLDTVNSNVGSFGSATQVGTFTVNGKGLITAASNTTITGTSPVGSALTSGDIWVGNASNLAAAVPVTGDITLSNTGAVVVTQINTVPLGSTTATSGNLLIANGSDWVTETVGSTYTSSSDIASLSSSGIFALNTTGVTAGSYIRSNITVDSKGRLTSASSNSGIAPAFITSGTTYTTPSTITTSTVLKITLIGGGGGGGGMNTTNGHSCGGGGGGVGVFMISNLTPSTAYTIAIGAAGAQGSSAPTAGGPGGTTSITIGATTYTATGGGGGPDTVSTVVGGLGGTTTNCTISIQGQNGQGSGSASAVGLPGFGGSTGLGWGIGGVGTVVFFGTDGYGGSGYGGGGGGTTGTTAIGGGGSQGAIYIEYFN